jgi:hypothetical protein
MNPVRPFKIDPEKPFFIFDTRGDAHGVVIGEYLYDMRGDYIGYQRNDIHDVYTGAGEWVGNIIEDGRIVRKRNFERPPLDETKPKKQPTIRVTARVPLPPQTSDLGFNMLDVMEWDDEVFKRLSDLTPDMD